MVTISDDGIVPFLVWMWGMEPYSSFLFCTRDEKVRMDEMFVLTVSESAMRAHMPAMILAIIWCWFTPPLFSSTRSYLLSWLKNVLVLSRKKITRQVALCDTCLHAHAAACLCSLYRCPTLLQARAHTSSSRILPCSPNLEGEQRAPPQSGPWWKYQQRRVCPILFLFIPLSKHMLNEHRWSIELICVNDNYEYMAN